jgi:hypothetical protein
MISTFETRKGIKTKPDVLQSDTDLRGLYMETYALCTGQATSGYVLCNGGMGALKVDGVYCVE